MNIARTLDDELLRQPFSREHAAERFESYCRTAATYARTDNAIAVLSDLEAGESRIYYGGFAETLGLSLRGTSGSVRSIWETEILDRIHPDDLREKQWCEYRFFRLLKRLPERARADYLLLHPMRMRDRSGRYLPAMHRICYLAGDDNGCIRWALCLYNPAYVGLRSSCIVRTTDGRMKSLERPDGRGLLSEREREVLRLIGAGHTSKEVAVRLSISRHTVDRHRQNILEKLQAGNSVEACRLAGRLGLL